MKLFLRVSESQSVPRGSRCLAVRYFQFNIILSLLSLLCLPTLNFNILNNKILPVCGEVRLDWSGGREGGMLYWRLEEEIK